MPVSHRCHWHIGIGQPEAPSYLRLGCCLALRHIRWAVVPAVPMIVRQLRNQRRPVQAADRQFLVPVQASHAAMLLAPQPDLKTCCIAATQHEVSSAPGQEIVLHRVPDDLVGVVSNYVSRELAPDDATLFQAAPGQELVLLGVPDVLIDAVADAVELAVVRSHRRVAAHLNSTTVWDHKFWSASTGASLMERQYWSVMHITQSCPGCTAVNSAGPMT